MGAVELKKEIEKVLDTMPEDTLESVLTYLQSVKSVKQEDVALVNNIKKIMSEDRELLQKLAQ